MPTGVPLGSRAGQVAGIVTGAHTHLQPAPVTAVAASHPCQLYRHHASPHPTRTQWHHRFPQYLQARVWQQTRVQDPPRDSSPHMLWLCGLCHDSVHDWIAWLLREARIPDPQPGTAARREAQHAVALYRMAQDGWLP